MEPEQATFANLAEPNPENYGSIKEMTKSEGTHTEMPAVSEAPASITQPTESPSKAASDNPSFAMNSERDINNSRGSNIRASQEVRRSALLRESDLGLLRQKSTLPVSQVNPFVGTWQGVEGHYNTFKTVVLFPFAMIKLFICIILLLLCSGWCSLCLIGVKRPEDIGYVRRNYFINPGVRILSRVFLFVLGFFWIPVKGKRDPRARVMIGNHTTMLDVVVLLYMIAPSFLSKDTVLKVPLIGPICNAMQVIGVNRFSQEDRERTKISMRQHVSQKYAPPLLVFPEGTTSRYDTVLRFKPGAFEFGLPIQPVLLHWRWNFTDPSSCATTSVKNWALQILCQVYHYVELEYLPVLEPDPEEQGNALFFAANARRIILKALQQRARKKTCTPGFTHEVYEVQQSVDDFLVWKRMIKANVTDLPAALQTFSLESIRDAIEVASPVLTSRKRVDLGFTLAASERYIRIWHSSPIPGHEFKSLLSYDDLTHCTLGDTASPRARQIFIRAFLEAAVFSCSRDGAVDFRQFAMALIWLSNCTSVWGEPFTVFEEAPLDRGVVKWASVRARIAFTVLCATNIMKDAVTRDDFVRLVGEDRCKQTWDNVFPPKAQGESEATGPVMYELENFRDTIVNALTAPLTKEDIKEAEAKRAAYEIVEACFSQIDKHFQTSYYEGGAFFLTEAETRKIEKKEVPLAREESVEEKMVGDPLDVINASTANNTQ